MKTFITYTITRGS